MVVKDDDTFKIRDYREGTDSKTPCPKCGALIALNATTCHECGVHFRGRAVDVSPASMEYRSVDSPVLRRIALILLVALALLIVVGLIAVIGGG